MHSGRGLCEWETDSWAVGECGIQSAGFRVLGRATAPTRLSRTFRWCNGKTIRVRPCMKRVRWDWVALQAQLGRPREIRAADDIGCGPASVSSCLPLTATKPVVLKFYRVVSVASLAAVVYDKAIRPFSQPTASLASGQRPVLPECACITSPGRNITQDAQKKYPSATRHWYE